MANTETVKAERQPRKKTTVIGSVVGILVVLAGGAIAADNWARQQVAAYVTDKIVEVLELDSTEPVIVDIVDIAGTSVIAQVVTGRLDAVGVGVENVTIGEFTGGVKLAATGIPVDLSAPVDTVQVEFSVSEKSLQKIAGVLSASAVDSVVLEDSRIKLASAFSVFGFPVDVGVGIEPFARDGRIGFTPTDVVLNGTTSTASSLVSTYGTIAEKLLTTRSVCVARWLPKALTVDAVQVREKNLVITIGADKQIFNDASLAALGSCS